MKNKHIDRNGNDIDSNKWPCEVCIECGRRNTIIYKVHDNKWIDIMGNEDGVLCVTCLDEIAQEKNIQYNLTFIKAGYLPWYIASDKGE